MFIGLTKVIALGFFDGVHLGHAALMKKTVELARERNLSPAAATFNRHPASAPLINTLHDRLCLIERVSGISDVICFDFNDEFRATEPCDFIEIIVKQHGAAHLVAGYDYRFGRGGAGDTALLQREAACHGAGCTIVDAVEMDGAAVSSTRIRELIANGETLAASRYLGHPHQLSGVVAQGRKLGRTLGFPTVNIEIPCGVQPPKFGVYAVTVRRGATAYSGVANVGIKPTVANGNTPSVEVNIFDFGQDVYGETLTVEFGRFVRPEIKFSSIDELKLQMLSDRETVRRELSSQD